MYGYWSTFPAESAICQGILAVFKKRNAVVVIVKNNCIFAPAFGAPMFN